ncbi:MAG: thermonuclease family protein [Rhizobiaceae bacterium]
MATGSTYCGRRFGGSFLMIARCSMTFLAVVLAFSEVSAEQFEFCSGPVRVTCVVDGDTFWISGEKVRLADIDAPETGGSCEAERILAARAAGRLARLLSAGPLEIARDGKDRFGRTLAVVSVHGKSVGQTLVEEGLARPWTGRRVDNWCDTESG